MTTAAPLLLSGELDFDVLDDMRPDLGEATGLTVLVQSIYRRFATPRGTLPSPVDPPDPLDMDAGTDLLGLIGLGQQAGSVGKIQADVTREVQKEASVDPDSVAVVAVVDLSALPYTTTLTITGQALAGPFALTIGVQAFSSGAGTVTLLASGGSQ